MNYELALQIKEEGFPQREDQIEKEMGRENFTPLFGGYHLTLDEDFEGGYAEGYGKYCYTKYSSKEWLESEEGKKLTIYMPTLEEVIEACGDDLFSIQREEDDDGYIGWFASQGTRFFSRGPTPLEAVCRLWLALKQKTP